MIRSSSCRLHRDISRTFALSHSLRKEHNKIQLKKLGSILLQGKVGKGNNDHSIQKAAPASTKATQAHAILDDYADAHSAELEESTFNLGLMSKEDIRLQELFDDGRQFGCSGSGLVLRRNAALKALPDKVDLVDTPWEEIERVYSTVRDLDDDPSMHHKFKKRLNINTGSLVAARHSRMVEMCRSGRREQKLQNQPLELAFDNLFSFNVIGFDRSFFGMPLQTGRHAFKKPSTELTQAQRKQEPSTILREMLVDAQPFDTAIPVHKKDVNFMEDDALEETLMPYDVRPKSPELLFRLEGKPYIVSGIDNHNNLDHELTELKAKIKEEIFHLQRMLSSEISRCTISLFLGLGKELKRNQFLLVSQYPFSSKFTGPTFKYEFKYFDLFPLNAWLLRTRKHHRNLYKHLFKVVLLNLSEQLDTLTRLKYKLPTDRQEFLTKTSKQIDRLVRTRLKPLVVKERAKLRAGTNAVVHKQVLNSNFLRFHWVRKVKPSARGSRRRPILLRVAHAQSILSSAHDQLSVFLTAS